MPDGSIDLLELLLDWPESAESVDLPIASDGDHNDSPGLSASSFFST